MRSRVLQAICVLLCLGGAAFAASDPAALASERIKATLAERFPNIKVDQVNPAPWAGLYEIVTAGEVAYTTADAGLLFSGHVMDTKTKEDLTQARWNKVNSIDFSALPLDLAIKSVKGTGARKLAVFADPECPYCQQLEQEFKAVDDVTVYTFLFPLESLHPGSREKAVKIWCSEDRAATWVSWMTSHTEPTGSACASNPTATLLELGNKLKVNSTPTLFFADGHRVAGFMPKDQLERELVAKTP